MFTTFGILFSVLQSSPALADDLHLGANHNQISGVRVDIHGSLDRYSGLGFGARGEFAIVPNGIISGEVRDELALSLGADLMFAQSYFGWDYYGGGTYLVPIAAVQWNFYVGSHWSLFPEAGVAIVIGFDDREWKDNNGHNYGWIWAQPNLGLGARYHFDDNVALLLRISTPGGLQLGVVF